MNRLIYSMIYVALLIILVSCTGSSGNLYIKELGIESDLSLKEFSYKQIPNMLIIQKNGKDYFAVYPLYPNFDIKKEYNLAEPIFVSSGSIKIYEQSTSNGKQYAAETSYPFFIIPAEQPPSQELEEDILLFLKTLRERGSQKQDEEIDNENSDVAQQFPVQYISTSYNLTDTLELYNKMKKSRTETDPDMLTRLRVQIPHQAAPYFQQYIDAGCKYKYGNAGGVITCQAGTHFYSDFSDTFECRDLSMVYGGLPVGLPLFNCIIVDKVNNKKINEKNDLIKYYGQIDTEDKAHNFVLLSLEHVGKDIRDRKTKEVIHKGTAIKNG